MSLKKRLKKKVRSAYENVKDFKGNILDKVSDTGNRIGDAAKRTGEKARSAYQRYKDPLAIGLINALGIALAIPTGGASLAGAALATGAYTGARQAHLQDKATKRSEKEFAAQTAGLEGGGLSMALRRRRLQRGAGDAVASYESETTRPGYDEQEVAA